MAILNSPSAHVQLTQRILSPDFPCVAARSVVNRQSYRLGRYGKLGSLKAAQSLCDDLVAFNGDPPSSRSPFSSFVAMFEGPMALSELEFEALLWRQLQLMHDVDVEHHDWDSSVSADPANEDFSFSVGARAFFIIGMHPGASRQARVMPQPCLVFNPHEQFETLRKSGGYPKLQQLIRRRDLAFQGSINPMLNDFGQQAESRQYSGRAVPNDWKCPFHQHRKEIT